MGTALKGKIRELESEHDIPAKYRVQWLQDQLHASKNPRDKLACQTAIKRIQRSGSKGKYPVFYNIEGLVAAAFPKGQPEDMPQHLDRLILQLRLTTLMRSVDAANVVWAIFEQDGQHYVKTTNKAGALQTFSVSGRTRETLLAYMAKHLLFPAQFLFRYIADATQCLGAERIAKRLLNVMRDAGIDTQIFKAHSLRGATATHLLARGVPAHMVQARGQWGSAKTMDDYYNRLHQTRDWQKLLHGEHDACRHSAACAVLDPSASQANPTEEGGSWEDQGRAHAQAAALSARGVLRPLYDAAVCPACGFGMQSEAAYACMSCDKRYHVRCLGTKAAQPPARQQAFLTTCFLCSVPGGRVVGRGGDGIRSPALIVDAMGVCDEQPPGREGERQ